MKAITLMYHDAVENDRYDESGFSGLGPALYKLDVHEMEAHFHRLSTLIPEPPCVVNDMTRDRTPLLLTFDDGGVSAATLIADLLEKRGWRGHFFVTAGLVHRAGFLSSSQIRDLKARGHLIGTHSWSHPERMSSCTWETLVEEWHRSIAFLSDLTGEQITAASVPGGFSSIAVVRTAALCGIQAIFTSEPVRRCRLVDGCLVLGRFRVTRGMTPSHVAALCSASTSGRQMQQYALRQIMKAPQLATGAYYPVIRAALLRVLEGKTRIASAAREQ